MYSHHRRISAQPLCFVLAKALSYEMIPGLHSPRNSSKSRRSVRGELHIARMLGAKTFRHSGLHVGQKTTGGVRPFSHALGYQTTRFRSQLTALARFVTASGCRAAALNQPSKTIIAYHSNRVPPIHSILNAAWAASVGNDFKSGSRSKINVLLKTVR